MNKLVRNEQKKLTATFLNGVAVAAIGVGGLAQVATMIQTQAVSQGAATFGAICVTFGVALHILGRGWLGGLEE